MRIAQIHFYYARNVVGYKHCRDIWILNRVSYINMQVADKKLWYDVICSVSYTSPLVIGPFIGRWIDRKGTICPSIILLNVIMLLGACLYSLPFSPWYQFTGRFALGFGYITRSLIFAHLPKLYSMDTLTHLYAFLHIGTVIGDGCGPMFNILMHNIDFNIGAINFRHYNAPMVLLSILFCFQIAAFSALSYFLNVETDSVHDGKKEKKKIHSIDMKFNDSSFIKDLGIIFKKEVLLMVVLSGYCGFTYSLCLQILPLVMNYLQYKDWSTNWYMFGCSVLCFGSLLVLAYIELTSIEFFNSGFMVLISILMIDIGYLLASRCLDVYFNVFVLAITAISFSILFTGLSTFPIGMLQKLIDPKHRTFGESIRMSVDIFCRFVAALLTSFIYDYFFFFTFFNLFISFLFVFFLCKWKAVFCTSKEIE